MEDCAARGEQKLSLASDCCRLSRSATFLITGLLCLAKHLLALSRLFGLRLSPLYVLKLSGFILLVRDQKRGAECFSAGASAVLHSVFHPSNLLAQNEYHTLGKSSRTFICAGSLFCCAPSFFRVPSSLLRTLRAHFATEKPGSEDTHRENVDGGHVWRRRRRRRKG